MTKPQPAVVSSAALRSGKKYFTLSDARRALPLVKRIAADIQTTQADRFRLHGELSTLAADLAGERIGQLQNALDKQTTRLENLVEELHKIGVDLKDPARALLDFPALHEGREIMLCWKGGEENITHWHEIDTGYAGRRPVEELHDQSV